MTHSPKRQYNLVSKRKLKSHVNVIVFDIVIIFLLIVTLVSFVLNEHTFSCDKYYILIQQNIMSLHAIISMFKSLIDQKV